MVADFQFQLNQSKAALVESEQKFQDYQSRFRHQDQVFVDLQGQCQILQEQSHHLQGQLQATVLE